MSARDELRRYVHLAADMWTPAKVTDERVERLYATVRTEVLAEADLLPKADVVTWLTKKAREKTPVEVLASKVDRGAVRPDNLRMLPPVFFEAGRTYKYEPLLILFRCDAIDVHPVTGEPSAVGWIRYNGGRWTAGDYSPAEYADGWTDVTEGGAS
ncbi:hypothetical protein ACIQSP_16695 [Streptomyces nigra]|uniref:hypothetical protein n=1 Tax=Streptomyces nigra TaxID=1827580 RepID=UPI00381CABA7